MPNKKAKKSGAKVRELFEQVHTLQMDHSRQLADLAQAIASRRDVEQTVGRDEISRKLEQLEERALALKAERSRLRARIASLESDGASANAVIERLHAQFEALRRRGVRLVENMEARLQQSAARRASLQEQHERLLDDLAGTGAHIIPSPLKPGGPVEQRMTVGAAPKRSLLRKPLSVTELVTQGDEANTRRDWRLAIECYAAALQRDPALAAIWVQFAHALKEEGLLGLAEVAYHRAAKVDPQSADAQLQLGYFRARLGQLDAAQNAFARALALDPSLAEVVKQSAPGAVSLEGQTDDPQLALQGFLDQTGIASQGKPTLASQERDITGLTPAESFNRSLSERYGPLLDEALGAPPGNDVVWLGVIEWHFRIQRPQHLATCLAAQGRRVFYISIEFERADSDGRFRIVSSPQLNVYEIKLRLRGALPPNIYGGFDAAQIDDMRDAMDEFMAVLAIRSPAVVVQYPSWYPIALGIPGALVIQDCLDLVGGFDNVPSSMVEMDRQLTREADLVVTSSQPLADHVGRTSVMVRNGAEVARFAAAARLEPRPEGHPPVIGYFGAIAEWFEIDWVLECARARPDWRFQLIGNVTGFDRAKKNIPDNVMFTGEIPYAELTAWLRNFDVALIPFKLTDLILCTNPVKLYEYMAAGKPVVATAMPEVVAATDLAYIFNGAAELEKQIERALVEDTPELQRRRMEWAATHTWEERAAIFANAIDASAPKVSVVILTHNNWVFTRACLHSVLKLSDYPNLEVIVVDNASTDETRAQLARLRDPRLKIILNDRNSGFAAGNNIGLRASTGDFVVILNNDTYVTRGWVRDLIRPLAIDAGIGLAGPVTNNIGNEQKLSIHYANMNEMASIARARVRRQLRSRCEVSGLAFFCVAMSRATLETVGLLDEVYGLGFFEDDDYCRRVEKAGLRMVVVDDAFVHHHLSASFDALGAEKKRSQMEKNKAIYEGRWGAWKPHVYRDAQGYGA